MSTPTDALIVLVEDDKEIQRLVRDLLVREGFSVEVAESGAALDQVLAGQRPDLVILDLMLPGEDGLSICRRLRARGGSVPILMLTAKADPIDRVVGLEMGADDYLAKPFNPRELLARVRALLRRVRGMIDAGAQPPLRLRRPRHRSRRAPAQHRGRRADRAHRRRVRAARPASCSGRAACSTRDQLLDWTRGRIAEAYDRTIDMTISRLRKKIEAATPGLELISTVRNNGYLFVHPVKSLPS